MNNNVIRFPAEATMKEALIEIADNYSDFEKFVLIGVKKGSTNYVIVNTLNTHRDLAGAANIVTNLADAAFESMEDLEC